MRLHEILESVEKLDEGGESAGVRFNTEIGTLLALAGKGDPTTFDPANPETHFNMALLANPDFIFSEIKKYLPKKYNPELLMKFYNRTKDEAFPAAIKKMKEMKVKKPTLFGWAGGKNKSDDGPSDVSFEGHPFGGFSIKDSGGITLANLTPKHLGLRTVYGEDLFYTHAGQEFMAFKMAAIKGTIKIASATPGKMYAPIKEKYSITYNAETNLYDITEGSEITSQTETDLLSENMRKNQTWHRVFGDHVNANKSDYKAYYQTLGKKLASLFEETMEDFLSKENRITTILQFTALPYFYLTPKSMYYIPKFDDLDDLVIKKIKFSEPDGVSLRFITLIGHPDSDKNAVMDIYIRYRNGLFSTNPTAAIQSLKNPENIYWEPLK